MVARAAGPATDQPQPLAVPGADAQRLIIETQLARCHAFAGDGKNAIFGSTIRTNANSTRMAAAIPEPASTSDGPGSARSPQCGDQVWLVAHVANRVVQFVRVVRSCPTSLSSFPMRTAMRF
jgi:hypothetical protein